nr:MAG TPA_asm: hypothetical protein [Caudoviricetes sp.]DAV68268.1 MAG TPA: hypothetical protein [Caudoviricetes sp.]
MAGARQRPHRPGVTAPDHGPTRRRQLRAEYPPVYGSQRPRAVNMYQDGFRGASQRL